MKLGFNMEFLSNPQRCKYLNLIIPSLLWLWPPLPRFPTQRNLHQAWWWTLDISVHRAFGAGSARFPWVFRSWCWKKSGDHQLKLVVYPIIYSQFFLKSQVVARFPSTVGNHAETSQINPSGCPMSSLRSHFETTFLCELQVTQVDMDSRRRFKTTNTTC